jgi:hypothetical protein
MDLNDDWIRQFEEVDELYKDFYRDDLYYIDFNFVYVNQDNEITKIKQKPFIMSQPNCILREEFIQILKTHSCEDNIPYSLYSILRYNILLEPYEIKHYLTDTLENSNYLTLVKNIDTIHFEKTINMFQDLNDVTILFYEKSNKTNKANKTNVTNRQNNKNNDNNDNNVNNFTKRNNMRHLNGAKKKTIRK